MYKKSAYNNYYNNKGKEYIWNSLTGAMALIDEHAKDIIEGRCEESEDTELVKILFNNGFFVNQNEDEYTLVKERCMKRLKDDNPNELNLVISPTLKCQYRCSYCFENGRDSYASMNDKVEKAVMDFVKQKLCMTDSIKRCRISWFGGEPLLRIDVIERLSNYFMKLCDDNGIEYTASIITNGRDLTDSAAKKLKALNVKKVQISVDGTKKLYCERKKATEEDYEKTINNIENASEILDKIVIRLNVSDDNFTDAYNLADELLDRHGLKGKIKISPACTIEGSYEARKKHYKEYIAFEKEYKAYIEGRYGKKSYHTKIPCARGTVCTLAAVNNFCIGPSGELYKCEHHFGRHQYIVGSVFDGADSKKQEDYLAVCEETIDKKECIKCSVFPVCMGGCPNATIGKIMNYDCDSYKNHLIYKAVEPRL